MPEAHMHAFAERRRGDLGGQGQIDQEHPLGGPEPVGIARQGGNPAASGEAQRRRRQRLDAAVGSASTPPAGVRTRLAAWRVPTSSASRSSAERK